MSLSEDKKKRMQEAINALQPVQKLKCIGLYKTYCEIHEEDDKLTSKECKCNYEANEQARVLVKTALAILQSDQQPTLQDEDL